MVRGIGETLRPRTSRLGLIGALLLLAPAAVRAERPLILVVARGGPGPDRAALAALAGAHGRVVFEEEAERILGEDPAEAGARRLRARARAAAERTRALYQQARPDRAAALAQAELDELAEPLAYAGATEELRELCFWLAVSLAKAGQAEPAQRAFARAADLGLKAPEPGLLPPEVARALEAGLRAAVARPQGALRVHTIPAGAAVVVDGKPAGKAPASLQLPAGEHYVSVERFGYQPVTRRVQVGSGPAQLLELGLEPAATQTLTRQIEARRRTGLDLGDATVIGALARLRSAAEVLTVTREPLGGRERLVAARWVPEWRRAAVAEALLPADAAARRAAVLGLDAQLWPPALQPPPPPATRRPPVWKRWWFWTIVGGAATAAAVGAGVGWAATHADHTYRIISR
jgi:hypothetical protein